MKASGRRNELKNESLWSALAEPRSYEPLRQDAVADVCVIGAGIAGLSVAYRLAQEGNKVLVLDDGRLAAGMTSRTTAHLVTAVDDRYFNLAELHNHEVATAVANAHKWALDRIEATVQLEDIACDFERVDGYLTLASGDEPHTLERERDAAISAGLGVELVEHDVFPKCGPQIALRFPRQAQFHPLHYVEGLADALIRHGGRICGDTHVDDVAGGEPVVVRAGNHLVHADAVVVATNSPFTERIAIHTKQAPYMT
ncbi:MAG: NAD(P)/FAD-dependent oxidoreductase, partial [Gemmatimonadaceae bacterium]